jgi:hypothetical protein
LLAGREHRLIASDVLGDPGFGEVDGEGLSFRVANVQKTANYVTTHII